MGNQQRKQNLALSQDQPANQPTPPPPSADSAISTEQSAESQTLPAGTLTQSEADRLLASQAPPAQPEVVEVVADPPPAVAPTPPAAATPDITKLPAAQDLVRQLLDGQKAGSEKFWLVVLPDGSESRIEDFETVRELQDRIMELLGTECALYPFMGHWLGITQGTHRFMSTPFGMLPLFEIPKPEEVEVSRSGWVGQDEEVLEAPQTPEPLSELDDDAPTTPAASPRQGDDESAVFVN